MGWVVKYVSYRTLFHKTTGIHYRHAVTHSGYYSEVVGDEYDAQASLRLYVLEQAKILQLDGNVKGGGRLVRDYDHRFAGHGYGSHHPLLHASAHLVGEVFQSALRSGHPHLPQRLLSLVFEIPVQSLLKA